MYLICLLIYCLNYFAHCTPLDKSTLDDGNSQSVRQSECTASKFWNCFVSRIPSHYYSATKVDTVTAPTIVNKTKNGTAGRIFEAHVFYLNKVDPTSGELFVSATLRWRFKVSAPPRPTYRFLVFVVQSNETNRELARFQVDLHTNNETTLNLKAQPVMFIRFDNSDNVNYNDSAVLLDFGRTYIFRIAEVSIAEHNFSAVPLARPVEKAVTFSSLSSVVGDDVASCGALSSDTEQHRRELASRWSTSIRQITFYPLHLLLNVSFYGAPASMCIQRYAVELWFHDVVIHERKFVDASELVSVPALNSPLALVGSVAFDGLGRYTKYTIHVVPEERTNDGTCICEFSGKCGCVTIRSNLFTLNNIYNFYEDAVVENMTIPFLVYDDQSSTLYWLLAVFFLILTVIFLWLIILLAVFCASQKTHDKRNYVFVNMQPSKRHDAARKPLIRSAKPASVLILNAETRYGAETALLARIMMDSGVKVFYDRFESAIVEENVQRWAGKSVSEAEMRSAALIGCGDALARDIFDDAFYAAHAALVYTDPRIIHAKWESSARPLFGSAEQIFTIPRNLRVFFLTVGVVLNDDDVLYEELFMELRANVTTVVELPSLPSPVINKQMSRLETPLPILLTSSSRRKESEKIQLEHVQHEDIINKNERQSDEIQRQVKPEQTEGEEIQRDKPKWLRSSSDSNEKKAILALPMKTPDGRREREDDSGIYSGDCSDGLASPEFLPPLLQGFLRSVNV